MAYLASRTLRAESAIFGSGCGSLGALEQHLTGIFVCSVEEPAQGLVLCRIKLPQVEGPLLAREDPAESMTWTMLTSLSFLFTRFWTRVWSPVSSSELPHVRPVSFQEVSRVGKPNQNSGAAAHLGSRGFVM